LAHGSLHFLGLLSRGLQLSLLADGCIHTNGQGTVAKKAMSNSNLDNINSDLDNINDRQHQQYHSSSRRSNSGEL
jgi:pyruvate-formate lyase-activating enzyme